MTGFELYRLSRSAPGNSIDRLHCEQTFEQNKEGRYVTGVAFGERGRVVIAGSEHGKVDVFQVGKSQAQQVLTHGGEGDHIQVVAV